MFKFLSIPALLFVSLSVHANTTVETWDFTRSNQVNVGSSSSLTLTTASNSLTMTAWSANTAAGQVSQASFVLNNWGTNVDGHGVDNFNSGSQFILLEFTQPVMLESLISSWNSYHNANESLNTAYDAYLTVAGFNQNPFSSDSSWADVAQMTSVKAAYQNSTTNAIPGTGSSVHSFRDRQRVTTFVDSQLINYNTGNSGITGVARTTWLIGAYNHVFNVNGSPIFNGFDKLKFSSLTTSFNTPVTDVPAPATFALFGLGLLLLMRRRQKFVS